MVWLERFLGRELQRMGCLLHFNELPVKELAKKLYGKTTGPNTYEAELNDIVNNPDLTYKPIVKFKKIPSEGYDIPEEVVSDLSTHANYLYEFSKGLSEGEIDPDLATRYPGKQDHARWVTFINAMERDYASDPKPSKNKKRIVGYGVKVYGRMFFHIKYHPRLVDAPEKFFLWIITHSKTSKS
jgi:hypothetical protein